MVISSLRALPEAFANNVHRILPSSWYRQAEDSFVRTGYSKIENLEKIHTLKMANGNKKEIPIKCENTQKKKLMLDGIQQCLDKNIELDGLGFECSQAADTRHNLGFPLPFIKKAAAKYLPDVENQGPRIVMWHGTSWNPFTRNYSLLANVNRLFFPTWGKQVYSGSPSHILVHEIGHHLHGQQLERLAPHREFFESIEKALGKRLETSSDPIYNLANAKVALLDQQLALYEEMGKSLPKDGLHQKLQSLSELVEQASKLQQEYKPLLLSKAEKALIRKEMGHPHFTKANGHEFVAEMFASMIGGKKFSPEMMELYHKFHGPIPPGGF